jgi:hypothetical protein
VVDVFVKSSGMAVTVSPPKPAGSTVNVLAPDPSGIEPAVLVSGRDVDVSVNAYGAVLAPLPAPNSDVSLLLPVFVVAPDPKVFAPSPDAVVPSEPLPAYGSDGRSRSQKRTPLAT